MPVISYGPQAKVRAKRLLEALLNYANGELEDCDRLPIQINWQTERRLVVRTKIRFLEGLTAQDPYDGRLNKTQIKEALKRLEDFLQILEDNRLATQGAENWHFTLNLWHRKQETAANLQQFEAKWERLRSRRVGIGGSSEEIEQELEAKSQESEPEGLVANSQQLVASSHSKVPHADWGEALDVSVFYGRVEELATLEQWIIGDRCRLIMLAGMGGIGKTALSIKLAEQVSELQTPNAERRTPNAKHLSASPFKYIIWRSLRNAPPIEEMLVDLIQFLSNQQETQLSESIDGRISCLIKYLRASRCLLILDNVESVLRSDERTGSYRPGYEGYGQLFRCVGETHHNSCLILTSREKPKGLGVKEGRQHPVRSLKLTGLALEESQEILKQKGCFASEDHCQALVAQYSGNPLALKMIATTIQDLFDGDVAQFLAAGATIFGDISDLLDQQFSRLSSLEQQVMYWLAINREWVSLAELQEDMIPVVSQRGLLEALESLHLRSLIEINSARFTQQPVVMEYVTDWLVEQVCEEIREWAIGNGEAVDRRQKFLAPHSSLLNSSRPPIPLFQRLALIKAQTKDYLRNTQVRLILKPVADNLLARLGNRENVQQGLNRVLSTLRSDVESMAASCPSPQPSYAAGNLLNLLKHLEVDLSGYNFSGLTVWQVYLQGVNLHQVNFANSDLTKSVFTQTLGDILSATFNPDGKLLATGIDNDILLWQVADSRQLATFEGHTAWVTSVAFSPDERIFASGSHDQTVRLWDVHTEQCLNTLQGHTSWIRAIAFSPDGCMLASGSNDQTIRLWDTHSGRCLKVLQGHTSRVLSVVFSPTGQTLISSSDDQTVKIWDIHIGACLRTIETHVNWALSIALSPDGKTLVTGSDQNTVKFWDIHTGKCVGILPEYKAQVWSLAFSSNGQMLATAGEDTTVRLWDVETKQCLKTLQGHTDRVWLVEFSSDGQTLVTGGNDQTVRLWDVQTGQSLKTLEAYSNWVSSVAFSPDSQTLASSSKDQQIRLWNVSTGECLKQLQGHTSIVTSVVFNPNGQILASSSDDKTVKLWDVSTGECLSTLSGHQGWVQSVSFSPDGQLLVSGSDDQTVKIWDVHTSQCLQTLHGHTHRVKSVAYAPSAAYANSLGRGTLASGSDDQTVKLWDVSTGKCLRTLAGHTDWVLSVAFSSDGNLLATGSGDRSIKLWEISTGECLLTLDGHTQRVRSVAFSPDGGILTSGSEDQSVKLWDVRSGQCIKTLKAHSRVIWSVAFSMNGTTLASCSEDETIKIWDVRKPYSEPINSALERSSKNNNSEYVAGECLRTLRADRPYEAMNITGIIGLTSAQKKTLKALGAVEIE